MVDVQRLRALLAERGITQEKLAGKLGISQAQVSRKLKTGQFWPYEISFLAEYLQLQRPEELFFTGIGTQNAPNKRGNR